MNTQLRFLATSTCCVFLLMKAAVAYGHGNPIMVDGNNNTALTLSGDYVPLVAGFAAKAWDSHEDAALQAASNQRRTSIYPGYEVTNIGDEAPLQFEIIGRPDYTVPGNPERWLWFWSSSAGVTAVPGNARFDVIPLFNPSGGSIQVFQSSLGLGPTITMASPIGPYENTETHLLSYELRNSGSAQPGMYALFARLTSPGLEPSEPFLLGFRNQLAAEFYEQAVTEINQAASPSGDFNLDGTIDAADYPLWRKTINNEPEYELWRQGFGTSGTGGGTSGIAGGAAGVPEPGVIVMLATLASTAATALRAGTSQRRR